MDRHSPPPEEPSTRLDHPTDRAQLAPPYSTTRLGQAAWFRRTLPLGSEKARSNLRLACLCGPVDLINAEAHTDHQRLLSFFQDTVRC